MVRDHSVRVAIGPEPVWPAVVEAVQAAGAVICAPADAEALVWMQPDRTDELALVLARSPGLRWVQLPWTGVEEVAAAGLFTDQRVWTCGKGLYAQPCAEHALALTLAGLRRFRDHLRGERWDQKSGISLYGRRVTIVGGGGIARAFLELVDPFGVTATVVRRHPDPVPGAARTLGVSELADALADADVVLLALALTADTARIIGAAELGAMRSDAWLVNVARGALVDTAALVEALQSSTIAGAALDVTDPEPLPEGHPLWALPNCMITSHTASTWADARRALLARLTENVRRFAAGEALIGTVDPELGY